MNRRQISNTALLLLAAGLLAAGMSSCRKDIEFYRTEGEALERNCSEIEFSAYASGVATKALSYDPSYVLGYWDTTSTAYVPGKGIGVFAFYQKAKSNGYPNYYNKSTGEPTFMYNQRLERTSTDGSSYQFSYSPKKYWPNNVNDLISFFAYAPYDSTTAWEDIHMESNLVGDKITRHYELESNAEDQRDFLWTDPKLNMLKPDASESIDFSFRHICARLGVTCKINIDDDNAYATIDKVVFRAKFNASGDYIYRTATDSSCWEYLERSYHTKDYLLFRASSADEHRVRATVTRVGGDEGFLFPFPGTQDVTVTATVTQNVKVNLGTPEEETRRFSNDFSKTFTAMELEEGKAYDFLLSISIDPITISSANIADWALMGEVDYPIP